MNDPTKPRLEASGDDGEGGQVLQLVGSKALCDLGANPFGHAESVNGGDASDAGIWKISIHFNGKWHEFAILATDERAIELMHEGFILEEVHDMASAMQAAEAQDGNVQ